jgi:hypothetical protein
VLSASPQVVQPIADLVVEDGAPVNNYIRLSDVFADADHTDAQLTYTVEQVTPGGIVDVTIDVFSSFLGVDPIAGQQGSVQVVIRATDPALDFGEEQFTIDVVPSTAADVSLTVNSTPDDSTPLLTVTAGDADGIAQGAMVTIDVDLNYDGDFTDAGEQGYATGAAAWSPSLAEQQKLLPSDLVANKEFGDRVAIRGDYAIVGAPRDDAGGVDRGAAYVFEFDGNNWNQVAKLVGTDTAANDLFGSTVAIDQNFAFVGAPQHDGLGANSGAVYVFANAGGGVWNQVAKLTGSNTAAFHQFGSAVALQGNVAVIGAPGTTGEGLSGRADVFVFDGLNWTQAAALASPTPTANGRFGNSVAYDGQTIAIGAVDEGEGNVHLFEQAGQAWNYLATVSDPLEGVDFGNTVDLDGNVLVVEERGFCAGSIAIYEYDGNTWGLARSSRFSGHVAVEGNLIVRYGRCLTEKINSVWINTQCVTPSDSPYTLTGDISNGRVIAGYPDQDEAGNTRNGAAYIFDVLPAAAGTFAVASFEINPALADGDYYLRARVSDALGNEGTSLPMKHRVGPRDTTPPMVTAITRANSSPTGLSSVNFTVTFSEPVSDIEKGDFVLATTGTADGTISSVSAASGTTVTVTVNGITGDGTLGLNFDFDANDSVFDGAGNLARTDFIGESYTIDSTIECSFTVTQTGDGGLGALREAIQCANDTPGIQTIKFDIPGAGPHTIQPTSPLPTITEAVVIDGTTQTGYAGPPLIEIDGSNAGDGASGLTVGNGGDGSTIRGLAINRFDGQGILVSRRDNVLIEDNYLGTDPSGTIDLGNGEAGAHILNGANNTVRNNVISGNDIGVLVEGRLSTGNVIAGNLVGTDAAGNVSLKNRRVNVEIADAPSNTVGGTGTNDGNVIAGSRAGILIRGDDATGNQVQGNRIGTNAAGTAKIANNRGIEIKTLATGNTIGGAASAGNQISGNTKGVLLNSVRNNLVHGNLIGTNAAGDAALGNVLGVLIRGGSNNQIGNEPNVISGNVRDGLRIFGAVATGNVVVDNFIGTNLAGDAAVPNRNGISISRNASGNTIGGTSAADRNVISGNRDAGVFLLSNDNTVIGNYIGTDASGTLAVANGRGGVLIENAPNNTIGAASSGNAIGGNTQQGIRIAGLGATGNLIQGNAIGFDALTATPVPNRDGVRITNGASGNAVGGAVAGGANDIAYNTNRGVWINDGTCNIVTRNSIYNNAALGISIGGQARTSNDPDDPDIGANNLQNFPEFATVILDGGNLDIEYSIPTTVVNSTFPITIEFFLADSDGEEGETFLGQHSYTATGIANVSIIAGGVAGGSLIVATATDANGNTSEFSAAATVSETLLAANGQPSDGSTSRLTQSALEPIVAAAVDRFLLAGFADDLFDHVRVAIADLPGTTLGLTAGNVVTLDVNAAGYGWFIDDTPLDDHEFKLQGGHSQLAAGRIDLLTAVMHELGHIAGLPDLYVSAAGDDLMFGWIEAGARRPSPAASLADDAFAEF